MAQQLLTQSEIALLAMVDRSVVAHWRARRADAAPFPRPARTSDRQELFDAHAVVDWLSATGLGNNPLAAKHVVAFHPSGRRVLTDDPLFAGLSALLCLHVLAGDLPRDPDAVLDLADQFDPDDELLYSELRAAASDLEQLTSYASLLVAESLDASGPFDALLAGRRTPGSAPGWQVATSLQGLLLDLAINLADEAGFASPVLCLPRATDLPLLGALPDWFDERDGLRVAIHGPGDDPEARLGRRWLTAHGISSQALASADGSRLPPDAVVLARLDGVDQEADLRWLNELTVQLGAGVRAVILGAAGSLVGPLRLPRRGRPPASGAVLSAAGEERRQALRSGFTRAIVRLPDGLIPGNPALRTALWCLGPGREPAETYTLDVSAPLDAFSSAIVDDVVAAAGPVAARRGRGSIGQFVATHELILRAGDLVADVRPRLASTQGVLRRLDDLVPAVCRPLVNDWNLAVDQVHATTGLVERLSLGAAVDAGHAELIAGVTLDERDLVPGPDVPVFRRAGDVSGREHVLGVTHATLAGLPRHVQLTRPGDIVVGRGVPAARVDHRGGALVAAPARILRCFVPPARTADRAAEDAQAGRRRRQQRLVAELLAAEIEREASTSTSWRTWPVTLLPADAVPTAADAARVLDERRRRLESALDDTQQLMTTLASALGGGMCTLTLTSERKSA